MKRRTLLLLLLSCGPALLAVAAVGAAGPGKTGTHVKLVVDYGDGVEKHFTALPWHAGMTAFDALLAARKHRHGLAKLKHRGSGATLFVEQIDDLANEGRGRNWIFRINGKLADRSCGVQAIKAGDTVLWRFGKYR